MNRSIRTLALLMLVAAPLSAQDPAVRGEGLEVQVPVDVLGDLRGFLSLRTPDAMRLFVHRPLTTYLSEELGLDAKGMATRQHELFRKTLNDRLYATAVEPAAADSRFVVPVDAPLAVGGLGRRDTVSYLPLPVVKDTSTKALLPGALSQYGDLGIMINGNGQLGGAWSAYKPCDAARNVQCDPGLFPQLRPDMTFGVKIAGTIQERVHVNVNFDQKNEFDAENLLNVSYVGKPDEILRAIDVGDVSIRLPVSKYMTRGIPAGNFGIRATGQVGPFDFQAVGAQQKGDITQREFKVGGVGSQQSVVQQQQLITDDADYVQGQFFYIVDPTRIAGSPHFDAVALRPENAPASLRPKADGVIAVYRDERASTTSGVGNAELGRFLADALPPSTGLKHSGTFRRLKPDEEYVVHSSGLWITLKSPLRPEEALAMAYVTETGDTIGDVNAEQSPPGTTPQLRLLRGPASVHQPGAPTWIYEMHNVYRLDSSAGVELGSIEMKISLGDVAGGKTFQTVRGEQLPYIKFFGLDEDAPTDKLDDAQIYQPSRGSFGEASGTIPGTFIVFPTLQPFLDPAPIQSRGISALELKAALGSNANNAIYNEVDPVNRAAASRFKLNFDYRVKADGLASSFNLGAFGIREESEAITLGSTRLQRGVDYEIDYDIGQLTLRDAATLIATHPGAELKATYEQKPLFQVAPTSVVGLNARYTLGQRGQIDLVGLFQSEKSLMSRPQLGVEPGSIFLGGVSGGLELGGALLDRMFSAIPGLRLGNASRARLTGEIAMSSPNPNTQGDAYVEDFEATEELRIEPRRQDWVLGSRPESTIGDLGTLPLSLSALNAADLVWSHDFQNAGGSPGGAFRASEFIDHNIIVTGKESSEYGMYLYFGRGKGTSPEAKRWRSITTVLSPTGRDMSRSEYLELYVRDFGVSSGSKEAMALVFDIGTVSEDAFYVDSAGRTNGVYADGTPWGLGQLDEEARLAAREVWGPDKDARGLWDQQCVTEPTTVYVLGDPRTNCTRGNGVRNSEDLDGNGVLAQNDGQYFRYVVTLDQLSQYLVRNKAETGTEYQLYRIPLRSGTSVNGAGDATWRFIRHLRMTVTGEPVNVHGLALARMRIVGSRWTKRDVSGVNSGLLSDRPGSATADVRVGPVSALVDATYRIPISANANAQDPNTSIGANGAETNEKSLRISYDDLQPGDRAEVYYRYAQQARSFMNYRSLHLWALPKRGTWGVPDGERFVVKVGSDARNYYLFQTRLRPAVGNAVSRTSWLPEVEIDFDQWFALKAEAERRLITNPLPIGAQDTVWNADSTYAIVLEDRARAPNLQSVRELSFAIYNGSTMSTDGEIWIDDMRLTGATRKVGRATAIGLEMNGGEFLTGSLSYSHQDDVFQQLNENTSYVAAGDINVNADLHLDRLLPASLGIDMPLSVTHSNTGQTPTFLESTDVLAADLGALRATGGAQTRVGMSLRKTTPTSNPWLSILLDGSSLAFGYSTAVNKSITSRAEAGAWDASVRYSHAVITKSLDVVPGLVENVLRMISPEKVEKSDMFGRLLKSKLRLTPELVSFRSGFNEQNARTYNFDRILASPEDSLVLPIESPRRGLNNEIGIALRPFSALSTTFGLTSSRDMLEPERATQDPRVRSALANARGAIAGVDVGWETGRAINTSVTYEPVVAKWLLPVYTYTNLYSTNRMPSYLNGPADASDTLASLERRFESGRQTTARIRITPIDLLAAAFGPAPKTPTGAGKILRGAFSRIDNLELTWRNTINSAFERESTLPGLAYQLGLGDFQSFRFIGADTAARVLETGDFSTTAGYAVSKRMRVDLRYSDNELQGVDQRGGQRVQNDRHWPYVRFALRDLKVPESLQKVLISASLDAGVDRVNTTNLFGATTLQERTTKRLDLPVNSTLTFAHGIALTYGGKFTIGENEEPTGRRETLNGQHRVTLNSILPAPAFISPRFTQPLAAMLTFSQTNTQQCGTSSLLVDIKCSTQIKSTNRNGSFRLETGLQDMRVGLSLDYTARQNHVGLQSGMSQWTLNLFGNFNLNAGTMPELGGIR